MKIEKVVEIEYSSMGTQKEGDSLQINGQCKETQRYFFATVKF